MMMTTKTAFLCLSHNSQARGKKIATSILQPPASPRIRGSEPGCRDVGFGMKLRGHQPGRSLGSNHRM